jgi:RNA polymerase sigma factor (sigma-70 family)
MKIIQDSTVRPSMFASPACAENATISPPGLTTRSSPGTRAAVGPESCDRRSQRWGCLMAVAQAGDGQAYEQLLRELDLWLRRFFARRLPGPAADDARQDTLLAIHARRHSFTPSRAFVPWVAAIARYKWIDRLRDASRFAALSPGDDIPIADHGEAAIGAAALDDLLGRLKPAQANVIRLVKLQGLSIGQASGATGQSAALVKVNIHRGLKKLAALIASEVTTEGVPDARSISK